MFQQDRHEALRAAPWNEDDARAAILEIASSALSRFDPQILWPSHPMDSVPDGAAGVYMGATGVILGLDYLKRAGAIDYALDFRPALPAMVERDNVWLKNFPLGAYGSLLMGDLGTHLVAMRLAPDAKTADRIYQRASDNNALPLLELMWGTPGSMLVCLFMHALTGEARFEALYRAQAARLLADLEDTGAYRVWQQEIYGQRKRFLGPVHGFAGNMLALMKGWHWLTPEQQNTTAEVSMQTLAATAKLGDGGANWPANADEPDAAMLCQLCHGAPGMVMTFAEAPFTSPAFERLLVEGGNLTWAAGPLKKGSNFCHGTGGNAFALLRLYKRTGDTLWLERARGFAATSIAQTREASRANGRGRYSLWTGDPGVAVCLWSCITGESQFPGLDMI
ncbi:MAG TPA: LanC-like protein [Rhizomicrobium sp.]